MCGAPDENAFTQMKLQKLLANLQTFIDHGELVYGGNSWLLTYFKYSDLQII